MVRQMSIVPKKSQNLVYVIGFEKYVIEHLAAKKALSTPFKTS